MSELPVRDVEDDSLAAFLARERESLAAIGADDLVTEQQPQSATSAASSFPPVHSGTASGSTSPGLQAPPPFYMSAGSISGLGQRPASVSPTMATESLSSFQKLSISNPVSPASSLGGPADESIYMREWRAKQTERIALLDADEERRHEEILAQAQRDIETFYAEYTRMKLQNAEQHVTKSPQMTPSPVGVTTGGPATVDWAAVYQRVEASSSSGRSKAGKDLGRFRAVLASLAGGSKPASPAAAA